MQEHYRETQPCFLCSGVSKSLGTTLYAGSGHGGNTVLCTVHSLIQVSEERAGRSQQEVYRPQEV